jgi:hypothetical protein
MKKAVATSDTFAVWVIILSSIRTSSISFVKLGLQSTLTFLDNLISRQGTENIPVPRM